MKVLVLNCGSSSLKYQLFDMTSEEVLAKGLVERIGIDGSRVKHEKTGVEPLKFDIPIPNHKVGIKVVLDTLLDGDQGVIRNLDELRAVGHRVVHGGEKFARSVIVTPEVLDVIEECVPLAPLHNPANLMGIKAMMEVLPDVPQVAVFDTAFHQTMPDYAYIYGLPFHYYEKQRVRRYGFHGTSHFYVAYRAAEMLGKPIEDLKIVTCHLGNGSSISAVKGGRSIDTSLGFGTVPGVLMGTRCGDVDPTVILYLMEQDGIDPKSMSHIVHKESGLQGISGISSDLRDVEEAAAEGNDRARLALDILCYGIRKHVCAYAGAMGGIDAIVFTAGIGENSTTVRRMVCQGLEFLGAKINLERNNVRGKEAFINEPDSRVSIMVVPTNEELVIARDTRELAIG
ncbi:MAG TPA: acetate kinase [Synergistaceae bacterium]|jgi:acetate kinase|nr:MAG: Acetate kinase [Synergistales bacterium 57_84]KUK88977.1 MAG: Acetate kinase [Synergistales bacterium 58_81]HBG13985.1 acetate kinase [Synergistaceae bacterium]HCP07662.1 acetate kinase [Synergistaceae bacterium]HCR38340.1 acetate kinase [Synergistaceae bacterium]